MVRNANVWSFRANGLQIGPGYSEKASFFVSVFTYVSSLKLQRFAMMAHVLEVGLFLVISAELRAIQLARGRAPCVEMLCERLPTVGATAGRILDREAVDHNHHVSPRGARQRICSF